jgi:hypothetical protein
LLSTPLPMAGANPFLVRARQRGLKLDKYSLTTDFQPEVHPRKPRVPESERTREVLVPVLQIQLENLNPWPTTPL